VDELDDHIAWEIARTDMMRYELLEMPTPRQIAQRLPYELVVALTDAYRQGQGLRVGPTYRHDLFLRGLVEARGFHLTAFGCAVRRILIEEDRGQ
jgi:hypothetical protein